MNDNPNLITESGREHLPTDERIALLANDVVMLESGQNPNFRPEGSDLLAHLKVNGASIHDFNSMIGWVKNAVYLYKARRSMVTRHLVTECECQILAWRRGGHAELQRVKTERRNQKAITP